MRFLGLALISVAIVAGGFLAVQFYQRYFSPIPSPVFHGYPPERELGEQREQARDNAESEIDEGRLRWYFIPSYGDGLNPAELAQYKEQLRRSLRENCGVDLADIDLKAHPIEYYYEYNRFSKSHLQAVCKSVEWNSFGSR